MCVIYSPFSSYAPISLSLSLFQALSDANKCVDLNPSFVKGYTRQGVAHFGLNQFDEAAAAYQAGLKVDPNNAALKDGLADVQGKLKQQENPLGSLFGPDMWVKLNANPGQNRAHI